MKTRKELKAEYKQRTPRAGVFQIRNMKSGKVFIGSSTALDTIWNSLSFRLNADSYPNTGLQRDWKQLGAGSFTFEILHELKPSDDPAVDVRKELKELEMMTIEEIQPFGDRGYH